MMQLHKRSVMPESSCVQSNSTNRTAKLPDRVCPKTTPTFVFMLTSLCHVNKIDIIHADCRNVNMNVLNQDIVKCKDTCRLNCLYI